MARRPSLHLPQPGDRNVRALRDHQHKQFVGRVAQGLVQPHDRMNVELGLGDLVLWHPDIHPICQIVSIEAAPPEQQPPDASRFIHITLGMQIPVSGDIASAIPTLVLVRKAVQPETPDDPPAPPQEPPDASTDPPTD